MFRSRAHGNFEFQTIAFHSICIHVCILAEGIVHILYDTYVKHFADRENGENKSFGRLETTYMFKPTHLFIFISDGISMKSLFSCKLKFLVKCYFSVCLYTVMIILFDRIVLSVIFSPILYVFVTYKYLVIL